MIPMHPDVVDLFTEWTATNSEHIRRSRRLLADQHDPIDRRTVHRIVARIGAIAGIDDMHPHRLRHTLATQAINRGMRLEAIAALLGHRSLEMTLVYAKITDRVVADEYASVCEQIDALYNTANTPGALPAEIETAAMTRLRQESHARMLGNGLCTRPVELDCAAWTPSARPAPTSRPGPSSCPSSSANVTTPAPTASPTAPASTTTSSPAPRRPLLDTDPAYNAGSRAHKITTSTRLRPCGSCAWDRRSGTVDVETALSRIGDLEPRGPLTRSHRAWPRHLSTSVPRGTPDRSFGAPPF